MKAKRNLFAGLGWVIWKALATIGLPYAKNKVRHHGDSDQGRRRR